MLNQMIKIIVLAVAVLLSQGAWAAGNQQAGLQSNATEDSCVRETTWMRKNHMDLLKHDRVRTLQQGIRTADGKVIDGSLSECVNCHTKRDTQGSFIAINGVDNNGKKQFCRGCHSYVATKVDCFECHAAKPDSIESVAR